MASQMVDARVLRTTIEISAKAENGEVAVLTAGGKAIEFAGFRRAYVEGSDDPAAELEEQEAILPQCQVGDRIHTDGSTAVTLLGTEPKRHETSPPARFTEASLIKELERLGIGRPSTYAPTIATIVRRGYVFRQGKALVPSFTAFAVTTLLRDHFGDFVESDFTAEMEEDLDEISRGERESNAFLKQFYYGDKKHRGLLPAVEKGADKADYPLLDLGTDAESGEPVRIRIGRFGPFVQVAEGGPGRTASLPDDLAPADLTVERAMELVRVKAEGPRTVGVDPASGLNVYVMNGRYGAYVQLGETPEAPAKGSKKADKPEKPKRASLQAGMTEATITLPEALKLLSLPRVVGLHPDDNEPITTNFGRFGPYVKHNDEFRSLESEDDVFNISFDAALALIRAPKQSRRRQAVQKKVLKDLAQGETKLRVLAGRYGPYVTDGTTNASIPKGSNPEALTFEQAMELLEARRNAAPSPRRAAGRRRTAATARTSSGRARRKAVEA
jgi:DNA topoisomerase-1